MDISWSVGGDKNRALQTVSTIITSSLGGQGANQVVTQAVSPYTAYAIGQYFKNNDSLNRQDGGNRAGEGSKSHLLAHGLLAFATSYATGQSPETITATTLSTMGAEKLAPALGKLLYDTDKIADLTAEQKQTISNVLGTAGLVTGVVTAQATGADSISSVSAGQQVQSSVQNAVENNKSVSRTIDDSAEGCGEFTCAIYAGGKAIYEVGTFGFGSWHDEWRDKYDDGEITQEEYLKIGVAGGGAIALTEGYGGKLIGESSGIANKWVKSSLAKKEAEKKAIKNKVIENNVYRDDNYGYSWSQGKPKSFSQNLTAHWSKHKNEFPELKSQNDYYNYARNFVNNPPKDTLTKMRANGDKLFYQPSSNTFAIKDKSGSIKTLFRPDVKSHKYPTNLEYFYAQ